MLNYARSQHNYIGSCEVEFLVNLMYALIKNQVDTKLNGLVLNVQKYNELLFINYKL